MAGEQTQGVEQVELLDVRPDEAILANCAQIGAAAKAAREPRAIFREAAPDRKALWRTRAAPQRLQRRAMRLAQPQCHRMSQRCELVVHEGGEGRRGGRGGGEHDELHVQVLTGAEDALGRVGVESKVG